jgi:endonuclease/exonuclease/phosphatase family metal-dependent hydrolase
MSNCCKFTSLKIALLATTYLVCAGLLPAGCAHQTKSDTLDARSPHIVVMTFNVRLASVQDGANAWPNRRALFLQTIQKNNPDLLGCQEVVQVQAQFLQENLPDYTFLGGGRDDGQTRGEYSPIMARKSRFEVLDSGQFWLSPTPERVGVRGWDASYVRICTWARLRLLDTGLTIYYFNTHMDNNGATARAESGKLIRRVAAEKVAASAAQGKPDAVIVTGDFNSFEDAPGYQNLMFPAAPDGISLLDAYRQVHPTVSPDEATIHDFKGFTAGRRIDYILHSPHFRAISAEIDRAHEGNLYPSDHYPVVAELVVHRP